MRTQAFEKNLILPREEVASQNANPVEFSGCTHSFPLGVGWGMVPDTRKPVSVVQRPGL